MSKEENENKLVVLGPFNDFTFGVKTFQFIIVDDKAVVSRNKVVLEKERVPAIYNQNGLFYVVYETREPEKYREFLSSIPEGAELIKKIAMPKCPECGNWNVIVDADEMYCPRCKLSDFWNEETIWTPRQYDNSKLLTGKGVARIENAINMKIFYHSTGFKILVETSRGKEELGNITVDYVEGLGYIIRYHHDEPPEYKFCLIRVYVYNKTEYVKIIREATAEELVKISEATRDYSTLFEIFITLLNMNERDKAVEIALKNKLYFRMPQKILENYGLTELIREKKEEEHREIEKSGEQNLPVKTSREKKENLEEIEKYVENVEKAFREIDVPVSITVSSNTVEVRLKEYVKDWKFRKYVEKCRELGMKFDKERKVWVKYLQKRGKTVEQEN